MPGKALVEDNFALPGPVSTITSLGSGHIHDTFVVTCSDRSGSSYVLQRFNHRVFQYPEQVMNNIDKVLRHLDKPCGLQKIEVIRTKDDKLLYRSAQGVYWRMFTYLENSEAIDQLLRPVQATAAARAFGAFINAMEAIDPNELFVTIPDFHNLPARFDKFKSVLSSTSQQRRSSSGPLVDWVLSREIRVEQLAKFLNHPQIPIRVTHNDTKINNALFKKGTNQAIAVIDLDTVMPGLLLYDFGDMARTFCSSAFEEESPEPPEFRTDYFKALCEGFFSSFKQQISPEELASIEAGPWWMTFIMGIRFLTDYLEGDVYYKTTHPMQNLARAKNQLDLLIDIEKKQESINLAIRQQVNQNYS